MQTGRQEGRVLAPQLPGTGPCLSHPSTSHNHGYRPHGSRETPTAEKPTAKCAEHGLRPRELAGGAHWRPTAHPAGNELKLLKLQSFAHMVNDLIFLCFSSLQGGGQMECPRHMAVIRSK